MAIPIVIPFKPRPVVRKSESINRDAPANQLSNHEATIYTAAHGNEFSCATAQESQLEESVIGKNEW